MREEYWSKFFSLDLHYWLDWRLSKEPLSFWDGGCQGNWFVFFGASVTTLWKDRNRLVFSSVSYMGEAIWFDILHQVNLIVKEVMSLVPAYMESSRRELLVAWTLPPKNHYKVNVDGSYRKKKGVRLVGV